MGETQARRSRKITRRIQFHKNFHFHNSTQFHILISRIFNETRLQLLFPLLQHTCNPTKKHEDFRSLSKFSGNKQNQIPIKEKGTEQSKITKRNKNS